MVLGQEESRAEASRSETQGVEDSTGATEARGPMGLAVESWFLASHILQDGPKTNKILACEFQIQCSPFCRTIVGGN